MHPETHVPILLTGEPS